MAGCPDSEKNPRETRFVEMIFPDQTNHYGTLFGGAALKLMSKAAFVAASRFARKAVVMAASERVDFGVPVRLGEMFELSARIDRVGRSSMTVTVDTIAEALISGDRRSAMQGRFEMVAVDADGRPIPIAASAGHGAVEPADRIPQA